MSLSEIESASQVYADAKSILDDHINELREIISEEKKRKMPIIRRCVKSVKRAESKLVRLVKQNRSEFEKPKTRVLHGIKVGYRSVGTKFDYPEDEYLVKAIKKKLPDECETLISVKETPVKDALKIMSVRVLNSLGIKVDNPPDEVVVKDVKSETVKYAEALIKESTENEDGKSS